MNNAKTGNGSARLVSRLRLPGRLGGLACALLVAAGGCSASLEYGEVSGTVVVNNQPLANVLVTFVPEDRGSQKLPRSMGTTDAAGHFQLRSEDNRSGAIVGPHRIVLEDLAIYQAARSEDGTLLDKPGLRFAAQYSNLLHTPLRREVQPGEQQVELALEPAK